MKFTRKHIVFYSISAALLALVIAVRLWLPSYVQNKVNNTLNNIEGFKGAVKDVDLSILTAAYTLKEITLQKTNASMTDPIFKAEQIDLSLDWKALLKGRTVGKIEVLKPTLNYIRDESAELTQKDLHDKFRNAVRNLILLEINQIILKDGVVSFVDIQTEPRVNISLDSIQLSAINLANVNEDDDMLPSPVSATAKVYEGVLKLNMKVNVLQKTPMFSMNAELSTFNLKNLNSYLKAYQNYDVQQGSMSLYAEASTRDNKINGYVKPIVKDINVVAWKNNETSVEPELRGVEVALASWKYKHEVNDQVEDQLSTQIEFEGNLKDTKTNLWALTTETLQHSILKALMPVIEKSVMAEKAAQARVRRIRNSTLTPAEETTTAKKEGFIKRLFKKKKDKQESPAQSRKKRREDNKG